jgi:hypothetical protein
MQYIYIYIYISIYIFGAGSRFKSSGFRGWRTEDRGQMTDEKVGQPSTELVAGCGCHPPEA